MATKRRPCRHAGTQGYRGAKMPGRGGADGLRSRCASPGVGGAAAVDHRRAPKRQGAAHPPPWAHRSPTNASASASLAALRTEPRLGYRRPQPPAAAPALPCIGPAFWQRRCHAPPPALPPSPPPAMPEPPALRPRGATERAQRGLGAHGHLLPAARQRRKRRKVASRPCPAECVATWPSPPALPAGWARQAAHGCARCPWHATRKSPARASGRGGRRPPSRGSRCVRGNGRGAHALPGSPAAGAVRARRAAPAARRASAPRLAAGRPRASGSQNQRSRVRAAQSQVPRAGGRRQSKRGKNGRRRRAA
mmetsp:Transcript_53062/g.169947  ORF Transcript_53062/g.169947 Transcript_53062/m.169947 type:complete len:308 (+) Transcript_53062:82-1005(+)